MRAVADKRECHPDFGVLDFGPRSGDDIEILLLRNPPHVKQHHRTRDSPAPLPEVAATSPRIEQHRIEPARKDAQFGLRQSVLNPAPPVALTIHPHDIHLRVEPVHERPRQRLPRTVIREEAHILRKVRVINPCRPQTQQPCRKQRRESHRSRRADDELREVAALDEIQNLKHRREAQFLQLVLRQFKLADGRKVHHRKAGQRAPVATRDDRERVSVLRCRRRHSANRSRHTVHVFQRIGEPRTLCIAQHGRWPADERFANLAEPRAVRRHLPERQEIRAQRETHRCQHRHILNGFEHLSAAQFLHERREELIQQPVRKQARDEESAPLRLHHSRRHLGNMRIQIAVPRGRCELLPQTRPRWLCQLENLPRQNPLRQKSDLLTHRKLRRILALHEPRKRLPDEPASA